MGWLKQRFELSRGGVGDNVRSMEGLRGFAVFLVFLVHYVSLVDTWLPKPSAIDFFARALHTIGNTGVDLFFVLSGYLIYGSLISRPQPFRQFMARRVQRIYPAFMAVFLVYTTLSFLFPGESKIPPSLPAALIYLAQNFLLLPGLFPINPMITVAWSLSYEIFYYLAIPFVIVVLGLRRWSPAWRITFFMATAAAIAGYCAIYGGYIRLIMFVSGIVLHEAIHSCKIKGPTGMAGLLSLALGLLAMLLPAQGHGGFTLKICILFIAFFLLCASCFGRRTTWLARAFSWTPLRWLGNMSYSYYLIHGLTIKGCGRALGALPIPPDAGWILFWVLLPIIFALTLIQAAILFLLIERPFSLAPGSRRSTQELESARAAAPDSEVTAKAEAS
jgi:exopolysaccharide production protein ExoZ